MSATQTLASRVEALCGDLLQIHAPHGTELNARQWSTEAPLRMLLNNLDRDVAERPEDLVVYGGSGKAARTARTPAPGSSGARNSTACAPASNSIASARSQFASTCHAFRPDAFPIDT